MFKKVVKEFNKCKILFYKGEKALYKRTNEVVIVVDHLLPNVVTIRIKRSSKVFTEDYKYIALFDSPFEAAAQVVEVSVAVEELVKLPNTTIADLLYD